MAYVIVNKFSDHLPLYRQQDVLSRHGIFLARSTLCDWLAQCAQGLRPLVELMRKQLLLSPAINADETPVRVLDSTRDTTRQGYFWVYIGDDGHPYTVFDYRDSRSRDGPAEILKKFPRLFADGCLWVLRISRPEIGRPDHTGRLLGPCAPGVLRRPAESAARDVITSWV